MHFVGAWQSQIIYISTDRSFFVPFMPTAFKRISSLVLRGCNEFQTVDAVRFGHTPRRCGSFLILSPDAVCGVGGDPPVLGDDARVTGLFPGVPGPGRRGERARSAPARAHLSCHAGQGRAGRPAPRHRPPGIRAPFPDNAAEKWARLGNS